MTPDDPLAALRPERLPEAVSTTTTTDLLLAIVAGIALAIALSAVVGLFRRRPSARTDAIKALSAADSLPEADRPAAVAAALRHFVRRTEGEPAASLTGDAWLDQLDRTFRTRFFTDGEGRRLGPALYGPQAPGDRRIAGEVLALLRRWRRR